MASFDFYDQGVDDAQCSARKRKAFVLDASWKPLVDAVQAQKEHSEIGNQAWNNFCETFGHCAERENDSIDDKYTIAKRKIQKKRIFFKIGGFL